MTSVGPILMATSQFPKNGPLGTRISLLHGEAEGSISQANGAKRHAAGAFLGSGLHNQDINTALGYKFKLIIDTSLGSERKLR